MKREEGQDSQRSSGREVVGDCTASSERPPLSAFVAFLNSLEAPAFPLIVLLLLSSHSRIAHGAELFGGKGLVAHWAFDEASGIRAGDSAGGDNTGTLHGSPTASRLRGPLGAHSLVFFAPGLKVTGPDAGMPAGAAPGSLSLWFNRPPGVSNKVLLSYGTQKRGGARGLWIVRGNRLCFYFWGHPQDLHVDIEGGIVPDEWHHVAGTYDGAVARLYYDGEMIGQVAVKIDTGRSGHFQIGANLRDDGRDFLGLIDEVTVLDRALTAEGIRSHYASRAPILRSLTTEQLRAYHVRVREEEEAAGSLLRDRVASLGIDEIVFAVRQVDSDNHWYANFGYNVVDPERRRYYHDAGRLCRLNLRTGKVATLVNDPKGGVRDPQLHYDAKKILFSYRKGGQPYYHLYEIGLDGAGLRQLTSGSYDDIEPTYLPDGDIIFCSSRCKRWVPCYRTQVAVLYRCDGNGENIRQLSANVEHENTPWVLPDGRILYQRWEYVDRSQVGYHHLWTMNPDGTGQMVCFGNLHPNTEMIDAKPIPGTKKVVASFSPGHGRNEHAGVITIVDPRRGPDAREMAKAISRGRHYRDPYPISEDAFLVAGDTNILLMDGRGRCLQIYDLPKKWRQGRMKVHEPRPVRTRARELVVPSRVDLSKATGRVVLEDVHIGRNMQGVARGEIKKLLVLEVLPKPCNMFSGMEPLSYGGTFLLERILGTVPVESDGSAHFELPAMRALFFVALDEHDLSVKRMQSFMTLQPGETVGCVGCHEQRVRAPVSNTSLLALRRKPSRIQPIPNVPDVMDFPHDIQPILDKHCLGCHDYEKTAKGGPMSGGIILSGDRGPMFSHSFYMLTIASQFVDGRNLRKSNYPPRQIGSAASPLLKKLDGSHHGVNALDHERVLARLWIDSGAVYAGTYAALGSGSIGDYSGRGRPDLKWSSVKAAQAVMKQHCGGCHKGGLALPNSPSDNKRLVPWGERAMNHLSRRESQRYNPAFRFNRHLLYNLSRPEKSLLLLAPLDLQAGGLGMTRKMGQVFRDTQDPDYQTLLRSIRDAKQFLDQIKRFDMPGFRPRPEYVREMKRYGLLPSSLDPRRDPVDAYDAERLYWQSLWYQPSTAH